MGKIKIHPLSGFVTISPCHLYITFPWIIQIFGFILILTTLHVLLECVEIFRYLFFLIKYY